MADQNTTNYSFVKPEIGASEDTWGEKLNDNWDSADTEIKALEDSKVNNTGAETITGVKTFSDGIVSDVTGNVTGNLTGDVTGDVTGDAGTLDGSTKAEIVTLVLNAAYPVGSIYTNASNTSNPSTLLGFGTWEEVGAGRVLIGQDTGDALFDAMGETGGSKDSVIVSHSHTATTDTAGSHVHSITKAGGDNYIGNYIDVANNLGWSLASDAMNSAGDHSHNVTVNSSGESGSNKNLQPYVVVKMWKRTA